MSFKIYSGEDLPHQKWNSLTADSFFASPAFASLWRIFGGREIFLVEEKSNSFQAGMAGVVFGGGWLRRFKSMPDGLYGGPHFNSECSQDDKVKFIEEIVSYLHKGSFIRDDIYIPREELRNDFFSRKEGFTHIIEFEGSTYKPPDPKVRTDIRHGQKGAGEVCSRLDIEHLEDFHHLAIDTAARHGTKPRYPREFFQRLLKIAGTDPRVVWPAVIFEGKLAASHIYFLERGDIFYWQSYSDKNFATLKPNHLLLNYIIDYALKKGIRRLNLGGSPPGAENLIKFKENWGGKEYRYPYYTHIGGLGKILYWGRRR